MSARSESSDPGWWKDSHTSGWERVKEALRRRWPGSESWDDAEPAVRYGYGARQELGSELEWNEELELQLRREWEDMAPGRVWDDVRQFVHRGWLGP